MYPGYLWNTNRKAAAVRRRNGLSDERVDLPEKSRLCVVAIMKGEDRFLHEWICFYKEMGVGHFFLYNNGDYEATERVLAPFVAEGSVTHIPFPSIRGRECDHNKTRKYREENTQYLAYGDFLIRYSHNAEWVLKVDLDEFVFPRRATGLHSIADYLEGLGDTAYLTIPSWFYGSSGHIGAPDGLVTESYRYKVEEPLSYKCLARTDSIIVRSYSTEHDFNMRPTRRRNRYMDEVLCLNHYFTKSREDLIRKVGGFKFARKKLEGFESFNARPMVRDEGGILRYVPAVKSRMAEYAQPPSAEAASERSVHL